MAMKDVRQLVDLLAEYDSAKAAARVIRDIFVDRITIHVFDSETDSGYDIYELGPDGREYFATYLTEKAISIHEYLNSLEIKKPEKDDED